MNSLSRSPSCQTLLKTIKLAILKIDPLAKARPLGRRFFEYHRVKAGLKCQVLFNNRDGAKWIEVGWVLDGMPASNRNHAKALGRSFQAFIANNLVHCRRGNSTGNNYLFVAAFPLTENPSNAIIVAIAEYAIWIRDTGIITTA